MEIAPALRLAAGAALICAGACANAADPPICAARPGSSTPPCTVLAGHLQVETGLADWSLQNSDGVRETSLALGETTLRYGLTGRSEVLIDVTPWERSTSRGPGFADSASGFGDVVVGYKQLLTTADAAVQIALLPVVKLPTAGHALGAGKWEGALLVPIAFSIGKSPLSIGLTPEVDWAADGDGSGHHAAMAQVVSLGLALSERLSVSAELWGQWDWDPAGTGRQASANGSVAWLASNSVQLDAGANLGLNDQTPDTEFYAGVSKRF